jgi:hypothetical protein
MSAGWSGQLRGRSHESTQAFHGLLEMLNGEMSIAGGEFLLFAEPLQWSGREKVPGPVRKA